jgi:hypothetical protein
VAERGDVWTRYAYGQLPINIHPNDTYLRVFPDGEYDQAWQGVQKIEPIAAMGTNHMDIPNPYYREKADLTSIQYINPASDSIGAGPALIAAQEQDYVASQTENPSFVRAVLARLTGG